MLRRSASVGATASVGGGQASGSMAVAIFAPLVFAGAGAGYMMARMYGWDATTSTIVGGALGVAVPLAAVKLGPPNP